MTTVSNNTSSAVNPYDSLNKSTSEASAAAVAAASRDKAKKATKTLGQDQFLKLMTTQMTHQDPNNPMQNGEFLSQMAQFGTVSGIQDLQQSFASFSNSIQSAQSLQAASLVGRYVAVPTSTGILPAGGEISGKVNLANSTPSLQITITNATTKEVVDTIDLGSQAAGDIAFVWDGVNKDGTQVSPGAYKIDALATVDGKGVAQTTDIDSRVESVSMASGTTPMKINLAGANSVDFSKVKYIF